jgi:uncharacterized OsmC-like protein
MSTEHVAAALARIAEVLQHRPASGVHDDAPAMARWQHGTRVIAQHANGSAVETDMPTELGGSGDRVTPGWLFRAGLASCAVTSIALAAAAEGIVLTALEVRVTSRSDTRGLLGLADAHGAPVVAGPFDLALQVRIDAEGVAAERLRALVVAGCRRSPIPNAVEQATPFALQIEVGAG